MCTFTGTRASDAIGLKLAFDAAHSSALDLWLYVIKSKYFGLDKADVDFFRPINIKL